MQTLTLLVTDTTVAVPVPQFTVHLVISCSPLARFRSLASFSKVIANLVPSFIRYYCSYLQYKWNKLIGFVPYFMDLRLVSVLSHRFNLAINSVLILTVETNTFYKELFSIVLLFTADLFISQLLMQTYSKQGGEVKISPLYLFTIY